MKNFMRKKLNQKGLTLVELLAVIVILGIIAAIAVPAIGNIITNSKVSALKADGLNAIAAANIYFAENPVDENKGVTLVKLASDGYLEDTGGFKGDATAAVTKGTESATIAGTAKNGSTSVKFTGATTANINATGNKVNGTNVEISR